MEGEQIPGGVHRQNRTTFCPQQIEEVQAANWVQTNPKPTNETSTANEKKKHQQITSVSVAMKTHGRNSPPGLPICPEASASQLLQVQLGFPDRLAWLVLETNKHAPYIRLLILTIFIAVTFDLFQLGKHREPWSRECMESFWDTKFGSGIESDTCQDWAKASTQIVWRLSDLK